MNQPASSTLPAPALDQVVAGDKWQREYQAFLRLKPQLQQTHPGAFVTVHNGQVIDTGADDVELALRFFKQHGNMPVHIGYVSANSEPPARIPHYRQLGGSEG